MYQFSYAEVLDETPQGARQRERQAIERSIELLQAADKAGAQSREAVEALLFVRKLWSILIEDLAKAENDLPQQLRADLISIGLWVMREAEQIRLEKSDELQGHHRSLQDHSRRSRIGCRQWRARPGRSQQGTRGKVMEISTVNPNRTAQSTTPPRRPTPIPHPSTTTLSCGCSSPR